MRLELKLVDLQKPEIELKFELYLLKKQLSIQVQFTPKPPSMCSFFQYPKTVVLKHFSTTLPLKSNCPLFRAPRQ